MNNVEFAERLAKMWRDSRSASGKSQEYVARALGVSKKTIQNWEAGTASPNFRTGLEWFECIGVPAYPYIMALLYPDEMEDISAHTDIKELHKALHTYIDELDDFHVRELLYLLYGSHGSSPTGTLDVITAYLHLPLAMRVCIAESIRTHFQIADVNGWITDDEHVLPAIETIEKYLSTAKTAVLDGKGSYVFTGEKE